MLFIGTKIIWNASEEVGHKLTHYARSQVRPYPSHVILCVEIYRAHESLMMAMESGARSKKHIVQRPL